MMAGRDGSLDMEKIARRGRDEHRVRVAPRPQTQRREPIESLPVPAESEAVSGIARGWVPALLFIAAFTVVGGFTGGLGRPLFVLGCVAVAAFADVIGGRLATLGQGSQDGSFQERLQQYATLWSLPDSSLIGNGFTVTDVGSAGQMPVDGMIIACWMMMGIVVGILCLCGFFWAISGAVIRALLERSRQAVLVGAMAMGGLLQMPLANISAAEAGFLFWSFVVLIPVIDRGRAP